MNIKDYISSGILEAYALGEVTTEERTSVENLLAESPEAREELRKVEETLENLAFTSAIEPPASLKRKVMSRISAESDSSNDNVVQLKPDFTVWRYAAAASIAIALITSYLAFYYRQQWKETSVALNEIIAQNQQVAQDYNVVKQKLDKIQSDVSIIENTAFTKVVMKGTPNEKNAMASVYWNASTQEVYLSIQQLKAISEEKQFQLWAQVDGKMVDAGVFDGNFAGLLKMKSIANATAFAVTIEPRGGKPTPTLETLQVIGAATNPS